MQGIDLGTIYAKVMLDTSGMAAGIAQARAQLDSLGKSGPSAINNISNSTRNVSVEMNNLSGTVKGLSVTIKEASEQGRAKMLEQVYALRTIGSTAREVGGILSRAGDVGIRALTGLVTKGAELNQALVQIRNNTVMTDAEFAQMSAQTKQLGVETGAAMDQIAMGARHIRDYGFTGKAAMDQLTVATKAAVATQTDAGDTAQLLSRVMRVFNLDESKAAGAMNALWFAAANSNLMMKQLVDTSGRAFAMAAPMGIRFEEVAAAISVFAHQGLNGSQAATQLINDLKKLHAPTKQTSDYLDFLATKAGPDLRAAFTTAGLQANQLSGSFQLIAEKARASGIPLAEMLTHLFPGLRGETGALIGTAGQGLAGMQYSLGQISDMMQGRADPLTRRYADAQKQLGVQVGMLNNAFITMASVVAERLMPHIIALFDHIKNLATWFSKLPPWVQDGTLAFTAMAAVSLTLGGRLLSMVGAFYQIRAAMIALSAQGVTTMGILGGIAAGLARIALFIPKPTHDFKDTLKKAVLERLPPDVRARMEATRTPLRDRFSKSISDIDLELSSPVIDNARRDALLRDRAALVRDAQKMNMSVSGVLPAIPGLDKNLMVGNPPNEFKQWLEAQKEAGKSSRAGAAQAARDAKAHVAAMKDLRLDMARLSGDKEGYSFAQALEEFYVGKKRGIPIDMLTARLKAQVDKAVKDAADAAQKAQDKLYPMQKRMAIQAEELKAQGPEFAFGLAGGILGAMGYRGMGPYGPDRPTVYLDRINDFLDELGLTFERYQRIQKSLSQAAAMPDLNVLIGRGFSALGATAGISRGLGGGKDIDTVTADIARLHKVRNQVSADMFDTIMAQTDRIYRFDYEQQNLAGENYLRFLDYKLTLAQGNSDEMIAIMRERQRVEDDLNKQAGGVEKKRIDENTKTWRQALKNLQQQLGNIFANLFEDILSGQKNFIQSFIDAFKKMLIRIAAELAASEVMNALKGLFNIGGETQGSTKKQGGVGGLLSGLGPVGAGIGLITGILGFADGGMVPGPSGAARFAVVHGGERVLTPEQQGGVTINLHGVSVASDYDVDRMMDRLAWHAKNRLAVNPGTV